MIAGGSGVNAVAVALAIHQRPILAWSLFSAVLPTLVGRSPTFSS